MLALAASFCAYFALLVYCDLARPEPDGIAKEDGAVAAGSPAARAGLLPGDRVVMYDGVPIHGRVGWDRVAMNMAIGQPLQVAVVRDGRRIETTIVLERDARHWRTGEGLSLMTIRAAQLVTLVLGLVIGFKRPRALTARLGAWLLLTAGVFCVALPYRFAAVWRGLPLALGSVLWIPYLSTLAIPAILLTLFTTLPALRLRHSRGRVVATWLPMAIVVAPTAIDMWRMVYRPRAPAFTNDPFTPLIAVSIVYVGLVVGALVVAYRRLHDVNERRRVRVLTVGSTIGCLAAAVLSIAYRWFSPHRTVLGSPAFVALTFLLLACPLSFAYAILRHRLFDVRIIIRQGLRYALARRLLLSLVPVLGVALAVDLFLHREQALAAVLRTRLWVYLVIAGVAILAQARRGPWLDALDRRFFREQYDAYRLLRAVADDLRRAGSIERAALRVVAQIDAALHPHVVALFTRGADQVYRVAAAVPAAWSSVPLAPTHPAIALLEVLGKPLDLAPADSSIRHHLRPADLAILTSGGIELLVPVATALGRPAALIALGGRKSEEPYTQEDLDLLAAIGDSLAPMLDHPRPATAAPQPLEECPTCGLCFKKGTGRCPEDAEPLVASPLPHTLGERYELERRLGRGAMGAVYRASDHALDRKVAVKVVRSDLMGNLEASERFQTEARLAAALSHPNVVTVHDFGVAASGHAYLVMELLDGWTLREALRRAAPFSHERALHLLKGITGAVEAAHRRQLVHRDLKPENIFVVATAEGELVKVLDFGIARSLAPANGVTHLAYQTNGLIGTPRYMAPEQLRGEDVSPSWDVWALAVLAFEMLTARHPFEGGPLAAFVALAPQPPAVVEAAPLPGAVRLFFARALSADPVSRPPSAAGFYAELEQAWIAAGATT
jgi:tRNA A-37 threonylcarbamoyl transferase component Bud32